MEKKFGGENIKQLIITGICFGGVIACTQYLELLSQNWRLVLTIGAIILFAVYLLAEIFNVSLLAKVMLSLFLLAAILEAILLILVKTGVWENFTDAQSMRDFINSLDNYFLMVLIFVAIQFLQVCLIPIPGAVTTAAGTLAFGPLLGGLYSFIGIVLGSIVAFLVGRKFGYRFVRWMVGEDDLKKALKFIEGRDKVMFILIFLLPFFPDDVLCFVAGLTAMSLGAFTVIICATRVVTILSTAYVVEYVGKLFLVNKPLAIILCAVVLAGMCMLFFYGVKYGKEIEEFFTRKLNRFREKGKKAIKKLDTTLHVKTDEERLAEKKKRAAADTTGHSKKNEEVRSGTSSDEKSKK